MLYEVITDQGGIQAVLGAQAGRKVAIDRTVITSYSIHYTKLYDLSGINTPKKIGPMLRYADIVVITKGDIVSQAEREVFAYRVKNVNLKAKILSINGITGQGTLELSRLFTKASEVETVTGKQLRFTMPAALCSYCLGEREIGKDFQLGNVKKMNLI